MREADLIDSTDARDSVVVAIYKVLPVDEFIKLEC